MTLIIEVFMCFTDDSMLKIHPFSFNYLDLVFYHYKPSLFGLIEMEITFLHQNDGVKLGMNSLIFFSMSFRVHLWIYCPIKRLHRNRLNIIRKRIHSLQNNL